MFPEEPSLAPESPERRDRALGATDLVRAAASSEPAPPSDDFDIHVLALGGVRGVGTKGLRALLAHYGDPGRVWEEKPQALLQVLQSARLPDAERVVEDITRRPAELLRSARRSRKEFGLRQIRVVGAGDAAFPPQLLTLPDRPYWLFVQGNPQALREGTFVAVVGTREASPIGKATASRVTAAVVQEGLRVVSGLAEGIDAAAHGAAVRYEVPQVAVLGTGIHLDFPASTAGLRRRILETGGAVITEYLPNERYDKWRFVERDRLQAGLAAAVCPVEGREKGGTAHTVRFAEGYGRPVFGVRRGDPAPTNDLVRLLAARGKPVFDLATPNGLEDLRAFLRGLPGPRDPSPPPPRPEALFRDVLRGIDELRAELPTNGREGRWLVERIADRFGLRVRIEGSDGC